MPRLAIATLTAVSILAASAVPSLAKHSPYAEEETQIESALWLGSLESWQQAYDSSVATEELPALQGTEFDVKTVPTETYIIRWYKDN